MEEVKPVQKKKKPIKPLQDHRWEHEPAPKKLFSFLFTILFSFPFIWTSFSPWNVISLLKSVLEKAWVLQRDDVLRFG